MDFSNSPKVVSIRKSRINIALPHYQEMLLIDRDDAEQIRHFVEKVASEKSKRFSPSSDFIENTIGIDVRDKELGRLRVREKFVEFLFSVIKAREGDPKWLMRISGYASKCKEGLSWDEETGNPIRRTEPNDLFEHVYKQLYDDITAGTIITVTFCQRCKKMFVTTDPRIIYCTQSCQNTLKVENYRKKLREEKEGVG